MKTLNTIILILLFSPILTYSKIDVEKVKSDFEVMQNSGNAGREFWLTVTPRSIFKFDIPKRKIYYILGGNKKRHPLDSDYRKMLEDGTIKFEDMFNDQKDIYKQEVQP